MNASPPLALRLALILLWGGGAWAWPFQGHAQAPPPQRVGILVDPACTPAPREPARLQAEIALRLAQSVLVVNQADQADWVVRWAPTQDGCVVTLSQEAEEVAKMPLLASASPEEQTHAAVRMVWFMAMNEPQMTKENEEAIRSELDRWNKNAPRLEHFPAFPLFDNRLDTISFAPAFPPVSPPASAPPAPVLAVTTTEPPAAPPLPAPAPTTVGIGALVAAYSSEPEPYAMYALEVDMSIDQRWFIYGGFGYGAEGSYMLEDSVTDPRTVSLHVFRLPVGFGYEAKRGSFYFIRFLGGLHAAYWDFAEHVNDEGILDESDNALTFGAQLEMRVGLHFGPFEVGAGAGPTLQVGTEPLSFSPAQNTVQLQLLLFTRVFF